MGVGLLVAEQRQWGSRGSPPGSEKRDSSYHQHTAQFDYQLIVYDIVYVYSCVYVYIFTGCMEE